ncbi:MAG: glycosyltransferase family 4 protein [Leptolyngbyaceae cyanobacterium bins.59]|nr:glycosyltransferase family 4 protein [Leptolyngbyaceae cyanobacterium bins.59]
MTIHRISLVHPIGNPFARNAAIAFWELGILHEIITSIAYNPTVDQRWLSFLPASLRLALQAELGRRTWVPPDEVRMQTHPWREVLRIALAKSGLDRRLGFPRQQLADWVYADLDRHVAAHHLAELDAVYAYEDGAAATFDAAKQQGITCLYDLPIAFYPTSQRIQREEAALFPELAPALQAVQEPGWKLARKEREIQLADAIVVPSSFVRDSLVAAGVPSDRVHVIPFGAPIDYFQARSTPPSRFRPLFVGRVGPRKGVHYLLQAWQELQLPDAELRLVGINEFPPGWLERYGHLVDYIPSVPHASLPQYYHAASVLVLPSLVEGMALVLLEAMACGLPILTTPHAGGPDIITDGVEGFIIPIRDRGALKDRLEWCHQNPEALAEMGLAARRRAEQLTWGLYRERIGAIVREL